MTILSGIALTQFLGKERTLSHVDLSLQIVDHMLSNVMEEIERRLASQNERIRTTLHVNNVLDSQNSKEIEVIVCIGSCGFRIPKGNIRIQEEVFADTQLLIRSVFDGYNVCIFSHGQTRSGKTFTMTGPKEHMKETLE
ncbi:hypothetical protein OROMI_031377 [Orobanche minor]